MREKKEKSKGMSLIEVLVAISIFTIGIMGFTQLFMRSWQINSHTMQMGQTSLAVSQSVNKMVGYLRKTRQGDDGAYAIKAASKNDLVVFADYDKDGTAERLHFYLQSGQLKMGITKPTETIPKTYPSGDQTVVVITDKIVNDTNSPLFYYYNKNYPGDSANNPVPDPVDIFTIRLIKVSLKVNIDPAKNPTPLEMESFVELRNLNDYDRIF